MMPHIFSSFFSLPETGGVGGGSYFFFASLPGAERRRPAGLFGLRRPHQRQRIGGDIGGHRAAGGDDRAIADA